MRSSPHGHQSAMIGDTHGIPAFLVLRTTTPLICVNLRNLWIFEIRVSSVKIRGQRCTFIGCLAPHCQSSQCGRRHVPPAADAPVVFATCGPARQFPVGSRRIQEPSAKSRPRAQRTENSQITIPPHIALLKELEKCLRLMVDR